MGFFGLQIQKNEERIRERESGSIEVGVHAMIECYTCAVCSLFCELLVN